MSKFCAEEVKYLGCVLTRAGITPQTKKVSAILALKPPNSVKTLRHFLGLVQYYRDMWEKCSNMLAPLTDLLGECGATKTKKRPIQAWHWDKSHQKAFEDVKATLARDVTLAYPDFTKGFVLYTDASSRQLGAVIVQENRPIAFFSRKLTQAQKKYTVTELELLSIIETLKEFRGMLWGQKITVYTDHMNLMRDALGLQSSRVYHWRLLIEEFGPEIIYIKGIHNTVADAISRLEYDPAINPDQSCFLLQQTSDKTGIKVDDIKWQVVSKCLTECNFDDGETESICYSLQDAFANSGEEKDIFPLTVTEISDAQRADKVLCKFFKRGGEKESIVPQRYQVAIVNDTKVITDEKFCMVIPNRDLQR